MRIKRFLALTLALGLSVSMLSGCGKDGVISQVGEQGTISSSVELVQADKEDTVLPTYDKNSVEQSTTFVSLNEKDSYYKDQLDSRNVIAYNEIRNGYQDYKSEVLLSRTITEEELFKIMTIIYLDDPIMFNVKPQYDYYLDSNGYIYKVNLYYDMNEITYRSYVERIDNKLLGMYSTITRNAGSTDSITEETILNYILQDKSELTLYGVSASLRDYNTTITPIIDGGAWTSHGYTKWFVLACRYFGMNVAPVIGKLTNYSSEEKLVVDSGFNIESYADVRKNYMLVTEEEDGTIRYTVRYNYDNYYMWPIVKINSSWYHFDNVYGQFVSYRDPQYLNVASHKDLLYFVNDYTISMSRIFYYNEDILGSIPLCGSKQWQSYYRKGNFLLTHTEDQMLTYLTYLIESISTNEKITKNGFTYQFEDEQTLNYFVDNFDRLVNIYNSTHPAQILNYNIYVVRDELTVIGSGFKVKK